MTERQLIDESRREFSCFNVVQLATSRAAELAEFEASVNTLTVRATSKLQRLPVRLRRRAASHRIHRLPRRLHRFANDNDDVANRKNNVQKRAKLKSRRFRRRHLRLIALTTRLASFWMNNTKDASKMHKPAWLPTHLWHAKRFHMIDRWGWRLPNAPNDKVFKACQTAAKNGCLVLDLSYLTCLVVQAADHELSQVVQYVFKEDMNTESQVVQSDGLMPQLAAEVCGLLFANPGNSADDDRFYLQRGFLGPARLLLSPKDWPTAGFRSAYFWVHPAIGAKTYELLLQSVKTLFPSQITSTEVINIRDLTGQLCRIRLLGRQSHRLLGDILSPANASESEGNWPEWNHFYRTFPQASFVPNGTVLALPRCVDFRSNRPSLKIRNKNWVALQSAGIDAPTSFTTPSVDVQLNAQRELHKPLQSVALAWGVMPSSDPLFITHAGCDEQFNQSGMNALLIQNGSLNLRRHHPNTIGWDVILTRSQVFGNEQSLLRGSLAARDLIIACVYRGAEVGGQRDLIHWATVGTQGKAYTEAFPISLWPDTQAGCETDAESSANRLDRYNRLPPKLRPDYTELGTKHPFRAPWDELIVAYAPSHICHEIPCVPLVLRSSVFLHCIAQPLLQGKIHMINAIDEMFIRHNSLYRSLLMVNVQPTRRGIPEPCAILLAPRNDTDLCNNDASENRTHITPSDPTRIMDDRFVLGYVQEGGYDGSAGRGTGIGFISLAALVHVNRLPQFRTLRNGFARVFMKNPRSSCLRVVHLSISTSSTP